MQQAELINRKDKKNSSIVRCKRKDRIRRMSKVSDARLIRVGLVGSLAEAERRR